MNKITMKKKRKVVVSVVCDLCVFGSTARAIIDSHIGYEGICAMKQKDGPGPVMVSDTLYPAVYI